MNAFWRRRKPAPLTMADLIAAYPDIANALRGEGARDERDRIRTIYFAASHVRLHPLVERLMFDGRTPPEGAALAMVACMQAEIAICAEVGMQVLDRPAAQRH